MNTISNQQREAVAKMLKSGAGIRETERVVGVNRNTVMRYKRLLKEKDERTIPRKS